MEDVILKVENVSKQYRLGTRGTGSISHDLNRFWHTIRGKEDPYLKIGESNDRSTKGKSAYVWALKDINFEVNRGEVLGIIGKNGAGKSTLLKILSKVTGPTTGSIKSNGRIASLLEVGTGFHPEMTGKENIFLNGAILGMTKKEIFDKLDEIVSFSGCERYIDTPVKRYSSGMRVRLAFAVAAFLEPDILIVDEVLTVGDAEFQKKAIGKMQDISKGAGRTVLFVSHDLNAISQLCSRVILIDKGNIKKVGSASDIINVYLSNHSKSNSFKAKKNYNKPNQILEIKALNNKYESCSKFNYDESIYIDFKLKLSDSIIIQNLDFFVTILDSKKRRVFSCENSFVSNKLNLRIEPKTLVRGSYSIHAFINQPKIARLDEVEDVCFFNVIDNGSYLSKHGEYNYGSVFGNYKWIT